MKQLRLSKSLLCMGVVATLTLPTQAAESRHNSKATCPANTRSTAADPLSLDRAIRLALAHNPDLLASGARMDAATGRAVQARAWPNPELEVSSQDMPVSGSRSISQAKHMAGFSQVVPWPGKPSHCC